MATGGQDEDNDRVYVDLIRPAGSGTGGPATASVTFRRTKGRDSLKRLSDILSAYLPVHGDHDHHQRQPLIEEATDETAAADGVAVPPLSPGRVAYRTLMLLDVAGFRLNEFSSRENLVQDDDDTDAGAAAAVASGDPAADGDISGVALSKSGYAFLTFRDSPNILRLEINPRQPDAPVSKTCRQIQVKLRGGVSLVPTDIKVHEERLYACGYLKRQVEGGQVVATSVMVRCDLDGQVELASKELPQPRFFGFDIDPADGQLVVASPTPDGAAAQIFKMSPDFKRKLFKIQLGSRSHSWNRPEFVACLGGASSGKCWVAAEQADSPSGLAAGQVKHRLLTFPLRPRPTPPAESQQPPEAAEAAAASSSIKSWMRVSSWKFEDIKPGRLVAVKGGGGDGGDEDRLLMLSRDHGNLYWVSETLGCSALTHPASEGGQVFTAVCCLQEPCQQMRAASTTAVDLLAATKDSLYLLQAT